MKLLLHVGNEEIRRCEAKTEESKKAVVMGIEQSPDLSCQCSASDPRQLKPGYLEFDYHLHHFHLRTSKFYNYTVANELVPVRLLPFHLLLFCLQSGVSPTCKQNYIWTSK